MVMGMMRPRFFSIKAHLLFRKIPNKNFIVLLSSPFVIAALFCSHPFIIPKARPFLSEQRKIITNVMSRASADQIAENYETPELQKPRYVVKKVLAKQQQEGDGANVRRSIGRYFPCLTSICCSVSIVFPQLGFRCFSLSGQS